MAERPESCPSCGRMTSRGQEQWRKQSKPIFGTDLSKPISELLAKIRNDLTTARGQLSDIGFRYSGFKDCLEPIEGLLTCGLVSLYYEIERVKEWEKNREKEPA